MTRIWEEIIVEAGRKWGKKESSENNYASDMISMEENDKRHICIKRWVLGMLLNF